MLGYLGMIPLKKKNMIPGLFGEQASIVMKFTQYRPPQNSLWLSYDSPKSGTVTSCAENPGICRAFSGDQLWVFPQGW